MTSAAIASRRRRGKKLQAERSSEMRVRILQATLECLDGLGYADTTFATIAKRAGVSRGALQHHYPERNFLIAGALEMLGYNLEPDIIAAAKQKPGGAKRMAYVLDVLWEASLSPPVTAIQDVRAAARTDKQLREMLLPLEHRVREHQYTATAEALGGDPSRHRDYRSRIDAIFATMRGLAISLHLGWEKDDVQAAWERAREDFIAAFIRRRKSPSGADGTRSRLVRSDKRLADSR